MSFIRFAKFLGNPVGHFCEIVSQYFVGCTFLGFGSFGLPLLKLTKVVNVKYGAVHAT